MTAHFSTTGSAQAQSLSHATVGDVADNPDQRISEDIQLFVDRTLNLSIQFLSAIVTLGSFVVILWLLSQEAPLQLFGSELMFRATWSGRR